MYGLDCHAGLLKSIAAAELQVLGPLVLLVLQHMQAVCCDAQDSIAPLRFKAAQASPAVASSAGVSSNTELRSSSKDPMCEGLVYTPCTTYRKLNEVQVFH